MFFCKQKTAYEMRISDWSSDVCSSDLTARIRMVVQKITILVDKADDDVERLPEICRTGFERAVNDWRAEHLDDDRWFAIFGRFSVLQVRLPLHEHSGPKIHFPTVMQAMVDSAQRTAVLPFRIAIFVGGRSEEHTSELQSLMRISYAVFCLKNKKNY